MPTSPEGSVRAQRVWKRFRDRKPRYEIRQALKVARGLGRRSDWIWALKDVDFELQPGDALGLIGANGSGKSTLLKLLTGVMYPYAGRVEVSGRVGALIEIAAGIHPELTGRENVFLYASLLGLPRREVGSRFDDIIAFAEIGDAVDRQVKFYSSGMKMRLGFAVAAFLDPDVFLVDEALAVGDTAFQAKCIARMNEVLADGTTLVFVSHDLGAVTNICKRCIWLDQGVIRMDGPTPDVVAAYEAEFLPKGDPYHQATARPEGRQR